MTPVLDYGGMPLTARIVVNAVAAQVQIPRLAPLARDDGQGAPLARDDRQVQVQRVPE
jgi:hypothetical protein